jgi:hypothetical protein
MTRSTILKLFWGSLIGLLAGLVLMGITFALAISNNIFIMSGPDVSGIKSGALSWTLLGLMGLALLLLLSAAVAHFVAWIGAVLNTAQLPDKTWFVVLLVVGLLGLVFIATVAYVIAAQTGSKPRTRRVHCHRSAVFRSMCLNQPSAGRTSKSGRPAAILANSRNASRPGAAFHAVDSGPTPRTPSSVEMTTPERGREGG